MHIMNPHVPDNVVDLAKDPRIKRLLYEWDKDTGCLDVEFYPDKETSMTDVMILVAEGQDIDNVSEALVNQGLNLHEVQREIGTITGSVATESMDALSKVPGVSAVEVQRENTAFVGDDDHAKA